MISTTDKLYRCLLLVSLKYAPAAQQSFRFRHRVGISGTAQVFVMKLSFSYKMSIMCVTSNVYTSVNENNNDRGLAQAQNVHLSSFIALVSSVISAKNRLSIIPIWNWVLNSRTESEQPVPATNHQFHYYTAVTVLFRYHTVDMNETKRSAWRVKQSECFTVEVLL